MEIETVARMGRVVRVGEIESALPLEHTEVNAQIAGPLAVVAVRQRFGNPLTEPLELEYLFPLPAEAALVDFQLRLGRRLIRAEIEELEKARDEYAQARDEGRRAGLLEQRRANLFSVQIANLLPGESIQAEVRYQQRIKFEDDGYEFVFPMGLTPRYDRPSHPEEGLGVHAPAARPGEKVGTVELAVSLDAGLPCGEPHSPSHPLEVIRLDERRLNVRLAGDQIPDRDFVLRLPVAGSAPAAAVWCSPSSESGYFLATLLPPRAASDPMTERREFVFVLDRSGSMGGEPILQARNALRACLRALNPGDTFRILLFDDQLEWYRNEPSVVNQVTIDHADAFLGGVDARGGTEIIDALEASLGLPADPERTRFVVFLTDGAVSAETAALEKLRARLGSARVFTFGIGPSVNRALLSRMARQGRGTSEFLQADEDIEGAVIRFQDRVSFPCLTDINLRWENGRGWDLYPSRLPDLYLGQPLELSGRFFPKNGLARLVVCGRRGSETVEMILDLQVPPQPDPAIGRTWAKARVEELLEEAELNPQRADALRSAVIGLALEHRLLTPFTTFVALDAEQAVAGGKPLRVRVSHPLPQGLSFGPGAGQGPARHRSYMMAAPMPSAALPDQDLHFNMPCMDEGKAAAPLVFSRNRCSRPLAQEAPGRLEFDQNLIRPVPSGETWLRELARTQRLDGSWEGSLETSAAALLAFIRAGHTASSGNFRQVVRRAAEWLRQAQGEGFAALSRLVVLAALGEAPDGASAPGLAEWQARLQTFASSPLSEIKDAEDLRLAALSGRKAAVATALLGDPVLRHWAALVM